MIEYIKGQLTMLTPAHAVIEASGIGYSIQISLPTFTFLNGKEQAQLYIYEAIREDAHILYGFLSQSERQLFLLLISVSGIGANTARMIMSSYTADEIQDMIATGNVTALNAIKGIGAKTAQRIIVDLKDKILKIDGTQRNNRILHAASNPLRDEAVAALSMLGFNSAASQKAVDQLLKTNSNLRVEQLIKQALQIL